jgi:hypothetical protein
MQNRHIMFVYLVYKTFAAVLKHYQGVDRTRLQAAGPHQEFIHGNNFTHRVAGFNQSVKVLISGIASAHFITLFVFEKYAPAVPGNCSRDKAYIDIRREAKRLPGALDMLCRRKWVLE